MAQVPGTTRVTVVPLTVQIVVVSDVKFTAKPDEAVALIVIGEAEIG